MRLTFKIVGNIKVDYDIWEDDNDNQVENALIDVIAHHVDDVVDVHEISYTIFNRRRDFLSYILGCSPHNIDKIKEFDINGGMGFSVLRLSGTIEFDVVNGLKSVDDDVICDNIVTFLHDSICTYRNFIDENALYEAMLHKIPDGRDAIDVSFYYDYESTDCKASLEM